MAKDLESPDRSNVFLEALRFDLTNKFNRLSEGIFRHKILSLRTFLFMTFYAQTTPCAILEHLLLQKKIITFFFADKGFVPPSPPLTDMSAYNVSFILDGSFSLQWPLNHYIWPIRNWSEDKGKKFMQKMCLQIM